MRAVVFDGPNSVSVRDLPDPELRPGDVLVRPVLTGICGTDRHLLAGGFMATYPLVPGHEIVGQVEQLGDGGGGLAVGGLAVGDLVAVDNTEVCGACEPCRRGQPLYCSRFRSLGCNAPGGFADPDLDALDRLIRLNITAVTRLAGAVAPRFAARKDGAIVNISSILALIPEFTLGIYGATKSYVLTLSQSLQSELGSSGVYVQAVLPAATRTEIWERSGRSIDDLQIVMGVDELVDAALVGFDRRESITIPSLPDAKQWDAYNGARQAMLPNLAQLHAAERYRA